MAVMKVMKVMKMKRVQRLRGTQDSYRSLLLNKLRKEGGRDDLKGIVRKDVPEEGMNAMLRVPLKKRAGYPITRAKGSVDPKNWTTVEGKQVIVDFSREAWLPDDFTQGLKTTNKLACKKGGSGGTYTVYMNPEGRTFYHKWQVEDAMGVKFNVTTGWNGLLRQAQLTVEQMNLDSDSSFFRILSSAERSKLPQASEFHFGIVSARRTRTGDGLKGLATVQTAFRSAGVEPTWYVDADSVEEYRALGLKAVVGGKLTPARNLVLKHAREQGKVCVQCSDDISQWDYRHGEKAKNREMDTLNAAFDNAKQFIISPVAAVRFMLAKMRAAPEEPKPRLGGVYCLSNCSRTMADEPVSRRHFIIGDFFVDDNSGLLFDESLTLKEDYDFTCQHLQKYGSVMRFMRLCVAARHYSNEGGACAIRDAKGFQEQKNITILKNKWPNAIFDHGTRKNEVKLRWLNSNEEEDEDDEEDEEKPRPNRNKKALIGKVVKHIQKRKVVNYKPFSPEAIVTSTGKQPSVPYIAARCSQVNNLAVGVVCNGSLMCRDGSGKRRAYSISDLKYDISRGFLAIKGKA